MTLVYVGFGSNVGDAERAYAQARRRLQSTADQGDVRASELVRTAPVGGPPDQPPYANGCFELHTGWEPLDFLQRLQQIESDLGRVRSTRWGPRTVDLDLLLYGDQAIDLPGLTVPHPRLHLRRFALQPLEELAPTLRHPLLGRTIGELTQPMRELSRREIALMGGDSELADFASDRLVGRDGFRKLTFQSSSQARLIETAGKVIGVRLPPGTEAPAWILVARRPEEPSADDQPRTSAAVPAVDCLTNDPYAEIGYLAESLRPPIPS